MSAAGFFPIALPWARVASAATGVLTSVVLAQWADETAYGGVDWSVHHNPGNVGSFDGVPVASFPTLAEGVTAYVQLMNAPDRPQFAAAMRHFADYQGQAYALGAANPVWASGRYGNPPGSDLVRIIQLFDLARYDAPTPAPPALTEVDVMGITQLSNGHIAVAAVGAGASADHALVFVIDPATLKTSVIDATDGGGFNGPGGSLYTVQAG